MRLLRAPVRIVAVLLKELREVARRPGAVLSLVLGPILVMALFGLGFTGERQPMDTIVVVPEGAGVPRDAELYQRVAGPGVRIVEITSDAEGALRKVDEGAAYLAVIVPPDARQTIEAGRRAEIVVATNELDPVRHRAVVIVAEQVAAELNDVVIESIVRQARERVAPAGADALPPEVIAKPFKARIDDRAPVQRPSLLVFFAPAVLALVLQHLALTLTALSMVRERLSGAIDLFRVSPITTLEMLVGKYLAYGAIGAAVAALVVGATLLMGVPFRGDAAALALAVGLLIFASLGMGLLISLVSDSERQAVQLSMLVLLLTVFFSGFVLAVQEFRMPVRALSYALPATYGIALFQDEMLRGEAQQPWMLAALAGIGWALFVLCGLRLRAVLRV